MKLAIKKSFLIQAAFEFLAKFFLNYLTIWLLYLWLIFELCSFGPYLMKRTTCSWSRLLVALVSLGHGVLCSWRCIVVVLAAFIHFFPKRNTKPTKCHGFTWFIILFEHEQCHFVDPHFQTRPGCRWWCSWPLAAFGSSPTSSTLWCGKSPRTICRCKPCSGCFGCYSRCVCCGGIAGELDFEGGWVQDVWMESQIHWSFCKILQFFVAHYWRTWPSPHVFNHSGFHPLSPLATWRCVFKLTVAGRPNFFRGLVDAAAILWTIWGAANHPKELGGVYLIADTLIGDGAYGGLLKWGYHGVPPNHPV